MAMAMAARAGQGPSRLLALLAAASTVALAKADGAPPRELWASFTAGQPTLSSTVDLPAQATLPPPGELERVSQDSSEIVAGLVESFLHREHLEPGEAECLSGIASQMAGDIVAVSEMVALELEPVIGGDAQPSASSRAAPAGDAISRKVDEITRGATPPPAAEDKNLDFFFGGGRRLGGLAQGALLDIAPGLLMEMGVNLGKVVTAAHRAAKGCLHQDAIDALETAGRHMRSMRYVSGRLIANGADIVAELAEAIRGYEARDYRRFGAQLGLALRKALLSRGEGASLPEAAPGRRVVVNVTEGLLQGLFGPGAELDINVLGDIDRPPGSLKLDLHECVAENLGFLQAVWSEVMFFFGQRAAGALAEQDKMEWSGAVALTMLKLPRALEKCDLDPEQRRLLEGAVEALADGGAGLDLDVRGMRPVDRARLEAQIAGAVEDWARMRWRAFGGDLGKLLQEMAVTVYDQKYAARGAPALPPQRRPPVPATTLAATAAMATVVAVAVRARSRLQRGERRGSLLDVEVAAAPE